MSEWKCKLESNRWTWKSWDFSYELSWSALSLLAVAIVLGMWQPELLQRIITEIAAL